MSSHIELILEQGWNFIISIKEHEPLSALEVPLQQAWHLFTRPEFIVVPQPDKLPS